MLRRTALFALLIAGGLAALAPRAQAQQAGLYDVTGTNLDGTPYTGVAQIRSAGLTSFAIRWVIGSAAIDGFGFASGRTISVAYGLASRPGIGIYTLNPDGSMDGEWTIIGATQNGRERLVPRPPAAAPPGGAAGADAQPPGAAATPPTPAPAPAPVSAPPVAVPPAAATPAPRAPTR